jgi:thymidylate synthase ThyX
MRLVDKPKVYFVGKTTLNIEGVNAYLQDIGGPDWFVDPRVTEAESLVEIGGRMCYRSWQPWDPKKPECSNPNVTKVREGNNAYLANIIKSEHGAVLEHANLTFIFRDVSRVFCYHPGTEIFTREGWKFVGDLADDEWILTKNPETGKAQWSQNKKLHSFDYKGELITAQNSQFSLPPVTPDHLLWCAPYDVRAARGLSCREIMDSGLANKVQACEVYGKRIVLELGIDYEDQPHETYGDQIQIGPHWYHPAPFFAWLGWMATDGTTSSINEGRHHCQIDQSKVEHFGEIRELMNQLFGNRWSEYGPYTQAGIVHFRITDPDLQAFVIKHLGPSKVERKFSPYILSADPQCLSVFYREALKGDGNVHKENGHEVLYMPSVEAAGQWQFILARLGKTGNVRPVDRIGEEHEINGEMCRTNRMQYAVSVSRKNATMIKTDHWSKIPYDGKVYCPETDDGIVFVRYGTGLPMWCCNTHELVRHRAGMAYSQESLRFVRLNDIRFWLPDSVKVNDRAVTFFEKTIKSLERIQGTLFEIFDIDNEKNFSVKKKLTSMFRRLAPIGLATTIMATGNIRAWRHIIKMRTEDVAEEEIRLAIGQVAAICKKEYPNFFYDMHQNDAGEWKFEHEKV